MLTSTGPMLLALLFALLAVQGFALANTNMTHALEQRHGYKKGQMQAAISTIRSYYGKDYMSQINIFCNNLLEPNATRSGTSDNGTITTPPQNGTTPDAGQTTPGTGTSGGDQPATDSPSTTLPTTDDPSNPGSQTADDLLKLFQMSPRSSDSGSRGKGKAKAKAKAQASKSKKVGAGRNQNKGSSKGSAVAKAATGGAFFGAGARLKNGGGVSAQSVDAAALSDDVTPPGAGTTTPPDAGMTPDTAASTTPVTTGGSGTPATNNCTTTMPANNNNNNNNITTTIPPDSGNGPVGTEEPCPLTHNSTATAFPIPPFLRHMDKSILTEVCQFLVNSILLSSWTPTSTWSSTTPTPITVTASATPSPVA